MRHADSESDADFSLAEAPGLLDANAERARRVWPMRLWLAAPDWLFRVLGAAFFFGFFAFQARKYWMTSFQELGPYITYYGESIHMPWVPVLTDLTMLLIAIGFCLRFPPRDRAANGWVVSITLLTGFWPMLPFFGIHVLGWINGDWQAAYLGFLWRDQATPQLLLIYAALLTVGNALDVWGYAVLCRSVSIVPEARVLKTTGPYRIVRHPVYLGQFFAQAGVWLVAAQTHAVWISFYVLFVVLQLYRSRLEESVLEDAFGQPYREWKRKTFWFV